ncbi:short-chain dehydrogenase/reductase [Nocardia salmonicida]|uniref:short-chain dehydrogenase/reductase n=1 Tax=Nocardia salmonicida TaxID=53431 RepID=UPI00368B5F7C
MTLSKKVVLITGAGSGIGAQTARQLAQQGAYVVLVDRDLAAAQAVMASLPAGIRSLAIAADVTDTAQLEAAVQTAVAEFGGIDVVLANAGIAHAGTVAVSDVETLARTVEVNLTGVIRTVHATLPHVLHRRGYFLLVSSAACLKNVPGGSAYAAAKAGVEYFGGALRLEVAHRGVDVGVAHPAWIRTPMFDTQRELDSVRTGIEALPWPFNVVTDVDDCATAMIDAMERRSRKVYVPGALVLVDRLRGLFTGALWDRLVRPRAAATVSALERELRQRKALR